MESNKKQLKESKIITFSYNVPIEESGVYNSDFIIAGTAINATTTSNNHRFLPEVLEESAKSLVGVPLLIDHENKVENIKGRVFYADYDKDMSRIPFKAKVMDEKIRDMIRDGRLNSVSVGASVDPKNIEEAEDGALIPRHIVFKELSLVAVPADQGATFGIAMKEAYNKIKEENNETEISEIPILKSEAYVDLTKIIVTNDNHKNERRSNMSEQNQVEQTKVEVKEADKSAELIKVLEAQNKVLSEKMESMMAKITEMSKPKIEEKKVEIEEESEEESDESYKIVQESGSLKGGAFTVIRSKY